MDTFIENSFCRCCSSEGTFKDVSTKYHWMGVEEIYAEMLKECFNITLLSSEENKRGICELCITQLRNAANFKKQVLNTEDQFRKVLENKQPTEESIEFVIKSELEAQEGDVSDDNDNVSDAGDPDYVSPDFEMSVKEETEEIKPQAVKRTAQPSTSRAKKSKAEQPETSKHRLTKKKKIKLNGPSEERSRIAPMKRIEITINNDTKPTMCFKKKSEIDKHIDNIRIILESSNATPIKARGGLGYTCCFCKQSYIEPLDLKSHTLNSHKDAISTFMKGEQLMSFIVKLDITSLCCGICGNTFENMEFLAEHLRVKHNKPIHTEIKSHIVPFKFDGDILKCVVCKMEFNNFKILLTHMNIHYKNYVCEICGNGFVNKKILSAHGYRHEKSVSKCDYCDKIFDNRVKMKDHARAVHKCLNKRNKCGYCGEKFTDYTKKNDHEVKVHGTKPLELKCQACTKRFDNQRALTVHVKRYHLMERWREKRQKKNDDIR